MGNINEKCLEQLNPYFAAVRAVMELPLQAFDELPSKKVFDEYYLSEAGAGKIKDVINNARAIVGIELKGTPTMDDDRQTLLRSLKKIEDIGVQTKWKVSIELQDSIDAAKSFAESMLVDEYAQCACGAKA